MTAQLAWTRCLSIFLAFFPRPLRMERLGTALLENDNLPCGGQINGHHVVPKAGLRDSSGKLCQLHGLPGTRIFLDGPLTYESGLTLSGDITFHGREKLHQACINVWGLLTVVGSSTIQVSNCTNSDESLGADDNDWEELSGGCISAEGVLVEGGALSVSHCYSSEGAGINVGRMGFVQKSGKVNIFDSRAEIFGGAMHISADVTGLLMEGGSLTMRNCASLNHYGGGLHMNKGPVIQKAGTIKVENCTAFQGGGMYVANNFTQEGGTMEFQGCTTAAWGDGAGLYMRVGRITQVGGEIMFRNCSAARAGGGFYITSGNMTQMGGKMGFVHCTVRGSGGAFSIFQGNFVQKGGYLEMTGCAAQNSGGGFALKSGSLLQSEGTILADECASVDFDGGGIMLEIGNVEQTGGALVLRDCWAKGRGAGLLIRRGNLNQLDGKMVFERGRAHGAAEASCANLDDGSLVQTGGSMLFTECHSGSWGNFGGLSISGNLRQTDGQLLFYKCSSPQYGGALGVFGNVTQEGGYMEFSRCYAVEAGGAMYMSHGQLTQLGGQIEFQQCGTGRNLTDAMSADLRNKPLVGGGAVNLVSSSLVQKGGSMGFDSCTTEGRGAGVLILNGDLVQTGGTILVKNCTSETLAGGIGIQNGSVRQENGTLWISFSHAAQAGGGISVQDGSIQQLAGTMSFDSCSSDGVGGGMSVLSSNGILKLAGHSLFQHCVAGMSGGALYSNTQTELDSPIFIDDTMLSHLAVAVRGKLTMEKVSIANSLAFPFEARARELVVFEPPNCSLVPHGCTFTATWLSVKPPLCSRGTGLANRTKEGQSALGCGKCPTGYMQLINGESQVCRPCPTNAEICEPDRVKMLPGFMVSIRSSINDLSPSRRCAAPKACPGRFLPDEHVSMCADGYAGDGCLECNATTHAPTDGRSLHCTKCTDSQQPFLTELGYLLAKTAGIFAIAFLGGVAQEEGAETTTTSSILLNQLMAFAAAALISVAAAADTTAARANGTLTDMLVFVQHLLALSQADMGLTSFQCLLTAAGAVVSLWTTQMLSAVLPGLLILAFAMQDMKLALVAGSNCFLAGFAASFGKFLVAVPALEGSPESAPLFLPELPTNFSPTMGVVFFGALILICFAAVGLGWSYVLTSKPALPHVAYLRSAYLPDRSAAEVERAVRRMLLRLLPVLLPVGAYPASQLGSCCIILLMSLILFAYLKPYQEMWLNYTEMASISIALLMAIMANWALARDLEGSLTSAIDVFLLGAIASLGFLTGAALTLALLGYVSVEQKPRELLEDL